MSTPSAGTHGGGVRRPGRANFEVMPDPGLARALSLSLRLLTTACGAAIVTAAQQGCFKTCTDYGVILSLSREISGTTATLRGVFAESDSFAAAVGDGGVIVVRAEGGRWSPRDSGTAADLLAVAGPLASPIVVAVGAGGVAVRSEDDGETWTLVDTGVTVDLRAISFYDDDTALAVGDAVILRSSDAGQTWTPIELSAVGLRAVVATQPSYYADDSPRSILAVGDAGLALRSDDAGQTWQRVDIGTRADLRAAAIGYPSIDQSFIVLTADGEVWREREGQWEPVALAAEGELLALSPLGDWLAGASGAVLARVDAGEFEFGDFGLAQTAAERSRLLAVGGVATFGLAVGEGGAVVHAALTRVEVGTHRCLVTLTSGRPFTIDDTQRTAASSRRDDWTEALALAPVPAELAPRLAAAWTREALAEHASAAAFARTLLQLLALAAPPELIAATGAAIAEEVTHARRCFGLATFYAREPIGPGPLAIDGALSGPCELATLAATTAREGCINETIAAAIVGAAATLARDPAVRSCLEAIAADERRHAALAWRTLAWALRTGDDAVRQAVADVFATMPSLPDEPDATDLEPHGLLSLASRAAVLRATWRQVIAPQAATLIPPTMPFLG